MDLRLHQCRSDDQLLWGERSAPCERCIAEKRIRDLQEAARSSLIHAKRRWPDTKTSNLWPYTLRQATHTHNCVMSAKTRKVPLVDFSQVGEPAINVQTFHPFGCPAYALDLQLANGQKRTGQKRTPQHGSTIGLLLSLTTGNVSPQFHAIYDDHFDTARADASEKMPLSMWQQANYFDDPLAKDPSEHIQIGTDGAPKKRKTNQIPVPPPLKPTLDQ